MSSAAGGAPRDSMISIIDPSDATLRIAPLAAYGGAVFLFFHLMIVFFEEPHLRATRGRSYDLYCRAVPRWLGLPGRGPR
jgi:protein-S-isoprenylcysteine O-methyltransferase Ste14